MLAQYALGVMYANGKGVGKNEVEAAKWYRKAAEQGYALAQNNLGLMYQFGKGVEKDEIKAIQWFKKAAEQWDLKACMNLFWFTLIRYWIVSVILLVLVCGGLFTLLIKWTRKRKMCEAG